MASDKLLISLALIKTNWEEQQKDFVDMLIPFVLYSLSDTKQNDIVSITDTRKKLNDDFGIDIYNNVIETFFKRLASANNYKNPYLYRKKGVYYRTDCIIDIQAFDNQRKLNFERQSQAVKCFVDFLANQGIDNSSQAQQELISYLCKYGHNVLQNKLITQENTIWTKRVGEFIEYAYKTNENIFNYLKDIAKGGMLSNVYLNNNIKSNVSKKFKNVKIYFDTPLLMYILNYSGTALQKTTQELLDLLRRNGATVHSFEHNLAELESILNAYCNRYRRGELDTSYNFDYLIENDVKPEKIETDIPSLKNTLKSIGITIEETPLYTDTERNIDWNKFDNYISDNIHYTKSSRRENDINSIAAIYRLRKREIYHKYETCEALFVATNFNLVRFTQKYFKEQENKSGIPAIVDDTFLTSLLWLKDASHSDSLPTLKLIGDALAAQEPSKKFWDNFILRIDELKNRGEINEDEVIELKYGLFSKKNMFDVTEGDTEKISHETVCEVQRRNLRMQHREILAEKEQAIMEKNKALEEKDKIIKEKNKYISELIETKSTKYVKKLKRTKKVSEIMGIFLICIVVYIAVTILTYIFGNFSKIKFFVDLGFTASILTFGAILNNFTDELISRQTDKVSSFLYRHYSNMIRNHINYKEGEYADDIISYINQKYKYF